MKMNDNLFLAEDNCNFNIKVLNKVMLDVFKPFLENKTFFAVLSGAKGFGKTFMICLLAWFNTCNFLDYNCLLARYTFVSARTSYSNMMIKVANFLKKYGVTIIDKIEQKEIKFYNSENRCEWVFDNNRVIKVIGFDNPSRWEGVVAPVGEWGMFALDEVISLHDKILDEAEYMYYLNNMLIQVLRGKDLTTPIEEFDILKDGDFQYYKKQMVIFGFNNHSQDHPIYQYYVETILPLTDDRKFELKEKGFLIGINKDYQNIGATVIRGTTKLNQENLNDNLKSYAEGFKETNPEMYETLFMGGENELQIDQYSYRKELYEGANFFDPNDFYFKDFNKFWFEEITIGCDYADGGQLGDNTATIMVGFEFDSEGYVEGIYILQEDSINTRQFKNMVDKVSHIAKKIALWSKIYMHKNKIPFKKLIAFKIGQDSRTVRDFLAKFLEEKFSFKKDVLNNGMRIFKASGVHGWPIIDRHYKIKRLLAEGKIYFSKNLKVTKMFNGEEVTIKKNGHLYRELEKCLNHPDKDFRDERPKANNLDIINAFEHAISFFRYRLFKN